MEAELPHTIQPVSSRASLTFYSCTSNCLHLVGTIEPTRTERPFSINLIICDLSGWTSQPSWSPIYPNMAQDSDTPKATDKGKGKAVDEAKDEKPLINGKKEEDKKDSEPSSLLPGVMKILTHRPDDDDELSEEDQQLKNELDMIVERLTVSVM